MSEPRTHRQQNQIVLTLWGENDNHGLRIEEAIAFSLAVIPAMKLTQSNTRFQGLATAPVYFNTLSLRR